MNFDVASMVVNAGNNSPDLWSGVYGSLLGVGITILAMFALDWQNKIRWEKDSFQKKKNDLLLESLISIANCLSFIDHDKQRLINLNNDFNSPFKFSDFESFKSCSNNLSLLCVFYKDDCDYEKMKQLKKIATIIYRIASMIEDIKESKGNLWAELEKNKILYINDYDVFYVNYLKFISFISESKKHYDGKYYAFHKEFRDEYKDNFIKLIGDFYEIGSELHKKFENGCKL